MTVTLLFGDLRTGRIADTLDVTGCGWSVKANGAGEITVTVPRAEVADKSLRRGAAAAKTFLAVDVDGRIQEAGPIWSRPWDGDTLQLGAAGLWSLFDHRFVIPVLSAGLKVRTGADLGSTTVSGTDLGGIARALVAQAMAHVGGNLPVILPPATVGDRTETFPGWKLLRVGDQLRELTAREVGAPDIRFRPRYTTDRLGIEWVMECGTEDQPELSQLGDDWVFDANPAKTPVVKITTDEDATIMGQRAFAVGEGSEADTLMAEAYDPTLIDAGWPRLDIEESRTSVSEQDTLDGHAANLLDRSNRPIETWTVTVRREAAVEVLPGHYSRVVPRRDDPWLGEGEHTQEAYMRVKTKSGDLGDDVRLEMYSVRGSV